MTSSLMLLLLMAESTIVSSIFDAPVGTLVLIAVSTKLPIIDGI